jgi:hypothetical protein
MSSFGDSAIAIVFLDHRRPGPGGSPSPLWFGLSSSFRHRVRCAADGKWLTVSPTAAATPQTLRVAVTPGSCRGRV